MAIERIIYASVLNGVKSDTPGYQEYTFTPNYMSVVGERSRLNGLLTSSYKAPNTYGYIDYYSETNCTRSDRNKASELARDEHPASFTYFNTDEGCAFSFGKNMGHSWDEARYPAVYMSSVYCEKKYIKKYPVLYCSSPLVCCDIKRGEFFPVKPNDESVPEKPQQLGYMKSLDDANDIRVKNSPGFVEITDDDVYCFIRTGNNANILISMVSALIKYKTGDEKCKIVIADSRENILYWIAAISMAFPLEQAINISFTSYGYSIGDYDINGVFVPELNDCKVESDLSVTDYNFESSVNEYAVYDFNKESFGDNFDVYSNSFMNMLKSAFAVDFNLLKNYKDYISENTSYRSIDENYMDGYLLYKLVCRNTSLITKELKSALEFSRKYSTPKERLRIINFLTENYKPYINVSEALSCIIKYLRKCIEDGLMSEAVFNKIFLNDVCEAFIDYKETKFEKFLELGKIAEKICGYKEGELETAIFETISGSKMYQLIETLHTIPLPEAYSRILYAHTALCYYVENKKGTFKGDSYESNISKIIISHFVAPEAAWSLDHIMEEVKKIVSDYNEQYYYIEIIEDIISLNGYDDLYNTVADYVAESYMSIDESRRKRYFSMINTSKYSNIYIKHIFSKVKSMNEASKKLDAYGDFLDIAGDLNFDFVKLLKNMVLNIEIDGEKLNVVYKQYKLLKRIEKEFGLLMLTEECIQLVKGYTRRIKSEYKKFSAPQNIITEIKEFYDMCQKFKMHGAEENTLLAYMVVNDMKSSLSRKDGGIFYGTSSCSKTVDYCKFVNVEASEYVLIAGEYLAEYWITKNYYPNFVNVMEVSEENMKDKAYSILFSCVLDSVIEKKNKNRANVLVKIVEYAMYVELDGFLEKLPDKLVRNVKSTDIIKPLEKDLDLKRGGGRIKDEILAGTDISLFVRCFSEIRKAYEEKGNSNSPMSNVKQGIANLFGKLGNKDK